MYFSGKITNSILTYLGKQGIDCEPFYELTEIPTEFLRDPTGWLDSSEVEGFLQGVEGECGCTVRGRNVIEEAGHNARELHGWGVLDSVLKMMVEPQDIFLQPQRFISYFVSPAPPLGNFQKSQDQVSFDIPVSSSEFPLVTLYLRSALEALPLFMNKEMAAVRWQTTRLTVSWSKNQAMLFSDDEAGKYLDPSFAQNLINLVQNMSQELDRLRSEMANKEALVGKLQNETSVFGPSSGRMLAEWQSDLRELEPVFKEIQGQFMRLVDYQTRAQQLVTLLAGSGTVSKAAKEAMHRVDWPIVRTEFQHVVERGVENLKFARERLEQIVQTPLPLTKEASRQQSLFSPTSPQL